jgi:hypothetical protein
MVLVRDVVGVDVKPGRLNYKGIGAMGNDIQTRRVGGTLAIATLVLAVGIPLAAVGKAEKLIICHAAGQDGTGNFVTLELSSQAVYGNGGHFEESGTPRAGHEGDHLGPCVEGATTGSGDTDVTVASGEDPPTTAPDETVSTWDESETEATTPTTKDPDDTNMAPDEPEVAAAGIDESEEGDQPAMAVNGGQNELAEEARVGDLVVQASGSEPGGDHAEAATLPFTGVGASSILPAALMLITGAICVFLTGGFASVSGGHVAADAERFRLGLHRGRHESG